MEGREAKHVFIARYSKNTIFQTRWEQVFRHEFISLIWLREKGYITKTGSKKESYVPERAATPDFCDCGFIYFLFI